MNTSWSRWLEQRKSVQAKAALKRRRVVLNLEALEERAVPSTYTVNDPTGMDSAGSVSGGGGNFTATTLRAAINAADGDPNSTIIVPGNANHYVLTSALPITAAMNIQGAGAASTIIDANHSSRVFEITGATTDVTLQGLTIENGVAPSGTLNLGDGLASRDAGGGGIIDEGHNLTIQSCVLQDNLAQGLEGTDSDISNGGNGFGGAIYQDDAVRSVGTLTITNTTLQRNQAVGGASYAGGGGLAGTGAGGAIYTRLGNLAIQSSTLANNTAQGGGAGDLFGDGGSGQGGGVAYFDTFGETLTVTDSTVYGNQAYGGMGGGEGHGGAALGGGLTSLASAKITTSTIANNRANGGSGGHGVGPAHGGGYDVEIADAPSAVTRIGSTIIATNSATGGEGINSQGQDVYTDNTGTEPFTSLGYNLIGNNDESGDGFTSGGGPNGSDLVGGTAAGDSGAVIDPLFDPLGLRDNGGPTETVALQFKVNPDGSAAPYSPTYDSPALDQGNDFVDPPPDQRGALRPVILGIPGRPAAADGTDIGAFEVQRVTMITIPQPPSPTTVGTPIADMAVLSGGFNPMGTVTFTLFNSDGTALFPPDVVNVQFVNGQYVATSPSHTPPPGNDHWVAVYSGDTHGNNPVTANAEPVTILPGPPPQPPPANTTPGYPGTFFAPPANPPPADPNFAGKVQLLGSDPTDVQAADTLFVNGLYHQLLGRAPDVGGLNAWVAALEGGMSRLQVTDAIWRSPEHRGLEVANDYRTFLHRPGSAADIAGWVNVFLAGASEAQVAQDFLLSTEYQAAHADNAAYVAGLYTDVLGRAPDGGAIGWQMALANGESRADVAAAFLTSPEVDAGLVNLYYTTYLHRSPAAGEAQPWILALEGGQLSPMQVGELILASPEFFANPH